MAPAASKRPLLRQRPACQVEVHKDSKDVSSSYSDRPCCNPRARGQVQPKHKNECPVREHEPAFPAPENTNRAEEERQRSRREFEKLALPRTLCSQRKNWQ